MPDVHHLGRRRSRRGRALRSSRRPIAGGARARGRRGRGAARGRVAGAPRATQAPEPARPRVRKPWRRSRRRSAWSAGSVAAESRPGRSSWRRCSSPRRGPPRLPSRCGRRVSGGSSTCARSRCRSSRRASTTSCGSPSRAIAPLDRTASRPAPSTRTRTGGRTSSFAAAVDPAALSGRHRHGRAGRRRSAAEQHRGSPHRQPVGVACTGDPGRDPAASRRPRPLARRGPEVMGEIMGGEATAAQIGGFLVALRAKGETADEIAGCAEAMREHVAAGPARARDDLVDVVGTRAATARGHSTSRRRRRSSRRPREPRVAKHGNRAVQLASGSADVLEALGLRARAVARADRARRSTSWASGSCSRRSTIRR